MSSASYRSSNSLYHSPLPPLPSSSRTKPMQAPVDPDSTWDLRLYDVPWGPEYYYYRPGMLPGHNGSMCLMLRSPTPPAKRRTALACELCRSRKAKCSGDSPTCVRCAEKGVQCVYPPESRKTTRISSSPPASPPPLFSFEQEEKSRQRTLRRVASSPSTSTSSSSSSLLTSAPSPGVFTFPPSSPGTPMDWGGGLDMAVKTKREEYDATQIMRAWQDEASDAPTMRHPLDGRHSPLREVQEDMGASYSVAHGFNGVFGADSFQEGPESRIHAPRPIRRPSSVPSVPFPSSAHRYHGPFSPSALDPSARYPEHVPHRSPHYVAPDSYNSAQQTPEQVQLRDIHAAHPMHSLQTLQDPPQLHPYTFQPATTAPQRPYIEPMPAYTDAYGVSGGASLMITPRDFTGMWEHDAAGSSFSSLTSANARSDARQVSLGIASSYTTSSNARGLHAIPDVSIGAASSSSGSAGYGYLTQSGPGYDQTFGWYAGGNYP